MTTSVEKVNGTTVASEPRIDPVRAAEAEAIRDRAAADRQALLAEAEGKRQLALQQAEQLRLANDKQRMANEATELRLARTRATENAKIAEAERKREEIERAREDDRREAAAKRHTEAAQTRAVEKSSKRWRNVALFFYALCAGVALPVQMNAFYDPDAEYLLVAPVFIEVIALVALVGAAAAVTASRPHWHYRLVAWAGALTAATINIVHGLAEYDPATAFGTALASIAGPGMWDLHEHGRIRKRDGKLSWRERYAAAKAAKAEAARRAAEEEERAAEKAAAEKATEAARQKNSEDREREFPDVWAEAVKIAAALAKTPDDWNVWVRAYRNIKGCEPGESIESITARRKAEARVEAALSGTPVNTVSKTTNAQRANQMPRSQRGPARKPPRRQAGDTQKYVAAARKQASIAAKKTAEKDPS